MNKLPNPALAAAAIQGITNPLFEDEDGYCQRFNRQSVQFVYGSKYNSLMKPSAKATAFALLDAGLACHASEINDYGGLQIGDMLFKTVGSGGYGHVGIYCGTRGVAENSSTELGRISGAKGFRTLDQWGHIDVIGRLPSPAGATEVQTAATPILYLLNNQVLQGATLKDGMIYAPASEVIRCLGVGTVAVRPFLGTLGYGITDTGDHRADKARFYIYAAPVAKTV